MRKFTLKYRALGTAFAATLAAVGTVAVPSQAQAQSSAVKPTNHVDIAVGAGKMVRLNGTMSDLFVADDQIADVQVRSANQIYIFGKGPGETTVYATNAAGSVIYSTNVRVGTNIDSIDTLLKTAMPQAQISAMPMNGVVLLTGTVAAPEDVEEAARLVQAYVGEQTKIISRLRTATPLQVMLKVTFAEVSRSVGKEIGFNFATRDATSGFQFGLFKGATVEEGEDGETINIPLNPARYTLDAVGTLFGVDVFSSLELAESDGRATILAEPTLTALSGETASFLAGGEFPIPISQSLGAISIEYKQYGVGLAFTPTVLADGRISMRVRPEVSELSDTGSIRLNNFQVPALTTRRAETTVELGSGQSFMIGGLLRNTGNNTTEKAPWLGDLPILGALFRSNSFRRQETELVIIVTPYLVRPVNANQIALPTDGFRNANDAQRLILDRQHDSLSGAERPGPVVGQPVEAGPGVGPSAETNPAPSNPTTFPQATAAVDHGAKPGFTF